jgi:hypothetical protein
MTLVVELFNIRVPKNAIIKKWFVNAHGSQWTFHVNLVNKDSHFKFGMRRVIKGQA